MFQLAGFDMMVPTPEILREIERINDPYMFVPWLRRSWPGFGLVGLAYPTGIRDIWIDYRQLKLNRFYWPTGASRWAFGHFVCGADQIDQIRPIAYNKDGLGMNAVTLKISCPGQLSPEILSTKVFVLACTPIGGLTGYENANPPYIVTVADDRYWWYYKSSSDYMIDDHTTWIGLLALMAGDLGVAIIPDTIDPDYLNPSRGLNLSYEYLPVLLDAFVYNVGHRFVRDYDGTCRTQGFQTALDALKADFAKFPQRTVRSGGSRYLDIS